MLPLNASHAYLLAAIGDLIRTKATVETKRGSFTFAAIASNLTHAAERGPPYASGLHMVVGFCDLT